MKYVKDRTEGFVDYHPCMNKKDFDCSILNVQQVIRDNKIKDVAVTLGPSQNSAMIPSLPPDSTMPEQSPAPPSSSNNLLRDFYENCVNVAGRDLCDGLFGGGRGGER
jgi:hypothetical protein